MNFTKHRHNLTRATTLLWQIFALCLMIGSLATPAQAGHHRISMASLSIDTNVAHGIVNINNSSNLSGHALHVGQNHTNAPCESTSCHKPLSDCASTCSISPCCNVPSVFASYADHFPNISREPENYALCVECAVLSVRSDQPFRPPIH